MAITYEELIKKLEFMVENPHLSQGVTNQIFSTLRYQAKRIEELISEVEELKRKDNDQEV